MHEMRVPARATLGTPCSQSTWHLPPMTRRSPDAGEVCEAPGAGLDEEGPLGPERDDGDECLVEVPELPVAVGRHAVATVAVVVEARALQGHPVAGLESLADLVEHRLG